MKRLLLAGVLFTITVLAAAQAPDRAIFQEAENRFQNQNYELALQRYNDLVREYPLSEYVPDTQYRRAVALFRLNRYEDSLDLLLRVESRYRSTQYLEFVPFWKGIVYYHLERYNDAISSLDAFLRATEETRVETQALLYMGLSQIAVENRVYAIDSLEVLINTAERPEDEPYALSLLLNQYVKQGDYERAVARFDDVEPEALPSQWRTFVTLYAAEAFHRTGELDRARQLYASLSDAPADIASVAYRRLFEIIRQQGAGQEQLIPLLQEAEQRLSGRTDVLKDLWRTVGIESYKAERRDLAELYLERVWELRGTEPVSSAVPLYLSRVYEDRGDMQEAVRVLEQYLGLTEGEKQPVLYRLANLYLERRNWQAAARSFSDYRSRYPDADQSLEAAYRYAFSLYRGGSLEEALSVIREQFQSGRTGMLASDMLWLQSVLYRELGNEPEAIETLRQYLTLVSGDHNAQVEYLKLLFVEQRYEEVVNESERLYPEPGSLEGESPEHFVQLQYVTGLSLIALQRYESALQRLNSYEASPEALSRLATSADFRVIYPYTLYYRGWAHHRQANYDQARQLFDTLLSVAEGHEFAPRAAYLAGWSAFSSGDYERAEQYLRRTRALDASTELQVQASFLLGQTLAADDRYEEAAVEFRNVFTDHPSSTYADDALFELAQVQLELERIDEGVNSYRRLHASYPESPLSEEAMYKRGEVLYRAERYEGARNAFFEYRSNFPEGDLFDAALYWGGMSSLRLGQASGALLLWEQLIEEHRGSPFRSAAMQRAAEIYQEEGQYREALNMLSDFIAAYPDEASRIGARREADELVLVIGGLSEEEASLWVEIDDNNRAESEEGREAILELARMIIYEGGSSGTTESLIVPLLEATTEKAETDPDAAARAFFLLGEHYNRQNELEQAADAFLDAAATNPDDRELVAESLFRTAQMQQLMGNVEEREAIVQEMESRFPDSDWTARAGSLGGSN
jgi:TolA-binding protein